MSSNYLTGKEVLDVLNLKRLDLLEKIREGLTPYDSETGWTIVDVNTLPTRPPFESQAEAELWVRINSASLGIASNDDLKRGITKQIHEAYGLSLSLEDWKKNWPRLDDISLKEKMTASHAQGVAALGEVVREAQYRHEMEIKNRATYMMAEPELQRPVVPERSIAVDLDDPDLEIEAFLFLRSDIETTPQEEAAPYAGTREEKILFGKKVADELRSEGIIEPRKIAAEIDRRFPRLLTDTELAETLPANPGSQISNDARVARGRRLRGKKK